MVKRGKKFFGYLSFKLFLQKLRKSRRPQDIIILPKKKRKGKSWEEKAKDKQEYIPLKSLAAHLKRKRK